MTQRASETVPLTPAIAEARIMPAGTPESKAPHFAKSELQREATALPCPGEELL